MTLLDAFYVGMLLWMDGYVAINGWLCGYGCLRGCWRNGALGHPLFKMMSGFLLAIDANNVLMRHAIYEEVFATSHGGYEVMVIG